MPHCLPQEVREQYEAARKPAERAAVVNDVVPCGATYSYKFCADGLSIAKLCKVFSSSSSTHTAKGHNMTELAMLWGHGDMARGEAAIEVAKGTAT